MPEPRECTLDEIEANIPAAEATNLRYRPIQVLITARTQESDGTWSIMFQRFGDEGMGIYEATWGDVEQMWAACPSTVPSTATHDKPGEAPVEGAYGKLYLSEPYLFEHSIDVDDELPKWPPKMGTIQPETAALGIYPFALVLSGVETLSGDFTPVTIDLLDPAYAATKQTIVLDGSSPVKVRLTQHAFEEYLLPFVPDTARVEQALAIVRKQGAHEPRAIASALTVLSSTASYLARGGKPEVLSGAARRGLEDLLARLAVE